MDIHDYSARYPYVPICTLTDIVAYWEMRRPVGSFLRAVLENDLMGAFARADIVNACNMQHIMAFIYTVLPTNTYGSPEKVKRWLNESK